MPRCKDVKRVLLVNPPNSMLRDSARRISEPLGLLSLGAVLRQHGYEVAVFDMPCEGYDHCVFDGDRVTYGSSVDDLQRRCRDFAPDVVGVTCMFTSREPEALGVCRALKEFEPSLVLVVGGLHPSLYPERFLVDGLADYVVLGEGEFRFLNLLRSLGVGNEIVPDGIAFRDTDRVVVYPQAAWIQNLDALPMPDRTLIDMERYIAIGTPFAPFSREDRVASILTTRGCPHACNFCSSVNYWGRRMRKRSVAHIVNEMKWLRKRYDIREIQFVDDNVTADTRFARQLFHEMVPLGFKFCTPNGLYFNSLDADMIRLMAEAGAYQLTVAIESASERVLKEIIHKRVNLGIVKKLIDEAHRYDISVHGMFIVGFPGEKRDEIMRTFEYPFEVGFDSASFFIANPLPGSELYRECVEKGYLRPDYSPADFKIANIHIPKNSPDYFMDPDELVALADERTHAFNEWSRKTYPERWEKKFARYLERYPDQRDVIMGRVT